MKRVQQTMSSRCDGICPCRENAVKLLIVLGCACALIAYFIFNVYRYATQDPVTVVTYEDQTSLRSPGIIICPENSEATSRPYGIYPVVFFQTISSDYPMLNNICQFYKTELSTDAPPLNCTAPTQFITYQFSTVQPTPRLCYNVPPGTVTMSDPRDSVWLGYHLFQLANTSSPGFGYTLSNNLFYGLYTNDDDLATTPIRLASAAGVTVVSFSIETFVPLRGDAKTSYSVSTSASTPSRPEATNYVAAVNGTCPFTTVPCPASRFDSGFFIIQPSALVITRRQELNVFGWTDVLGAIGGVFSIVMSIRVFLNGEEEDPEQNRGMVSRVFYATPVSAEAAADSDAKGAKLNSELDELRRRAVYDNKKSEGGPATASI